LQLGVASGGQGGAFCEERIEDDAGSGFGFAPDTEVARQAFTEAIGAWLIGLNCQSDGGCGTSVGGAPHTASEALAQNAGNQWELAAAAGNIERLKFRIA
jgi:hypothetical protein